MKSSKLLLINMVIVLAVACFFFVRSKTRNKPGLQVNREIKNALQLKLNGADYVPLRTAISGGDFLLDVPPNSITSDQAALLNASIVSLLKAYSDGSYDSIRDFLVPEGATFTYNEIVLNQIRSKETTNVAKLSDEEVIRFAIKKYSADEFYRNYFEGIVVRSNNITLAVGPTNEFGLTNLPGVTIIESKQYLPMEVPMYCLTNYITLGVRGPLQLHLLKPSAAEIISKEGSILYANIYFLVKPNSSIDPKACFPLLCQFYWVKEKNKWYPHCVARGNVWKELKYKVDLIF